MRLLLSFETIFLQTKTQTMDVPDLSDLDVEMEEHFPSDQELHIEEFEVEEEEVDEVMDEDLGEQ